ncbi:MULTISPECIES: AAA family ATPase [Chryseobacterium]|uniref:ATPase n=1 Tax=Chryseobacterium camelliae TaxID=1265445 RepID=A0ABU0TKJ9_9FLAO|nr:MULTISPECIES: AAA family ATPase [Chryseobacterium]MDT3409397.1 putative ATPase [Pseudacidovorax intermedius]MDQ1096738.1 putative ATPase [Chryseobacterium camelliae]MDQ1100682.1 putative ATPase [Chryseobacterium sp. SORGH_AS_1048]MDR6088020.1 putative ATPase [Chryseobacterium sp. SORGH_AS_0909]MDR6132395.1 putative ATPase [Chryseobacterium sp. SORGH_AS_1175]
MKIIVTGGPGMGKTSIIDTLKEMGYSTVPESGRNIIRNQAETCGDRLPWKDRKGFAEEMFHQAIEDFNCADRHDSLTFFDRGLPDAIGYLLLCQIPVPEAMWLAAQQYRYYEKVFITHPWKDIYINDEERKQTFEEAIKTFEVMDTLYRHLGYRVIEIPQTAVSERAGFILQEIGK